MDIFFSVKQGCFHSNRHLVLKLWAVKHMYIAIYCALPNLHLLPHTMQKMTWLRAVYCEQKSFEKVATRVNLNDTASLNILVQSRVKDTRNEDGNCLVISSPLCVFLALVSIHMYVLPVAGLGHCGTTDLCIGCSLVYSWSTISECTPT